MSVFSMMRFGVDERPAGIPFTRSSPPGGHVEMAAFPIDRRFLDHMEDEAGALSGEKKEDQGQSGGGLSADSGSQAPFRPAHDPF
jgi:hypothetical protein